MTAIVVVPLFPAASLAVTVMTLLPDCSVMPDADHEVVPEQVPEPPLSLDHVTAATPTLSEAVPPMERVDEVVVYVPLLTGEVIDILGVVVSGGL